MAASFSSREKRGDPVSLTLRLRRPSDTVALVGATGITVVSWFRDGRRGWRGWTNHQH